MARLFKDFNALQYNPDAEPGSSRHKHIPKKRLKSLAGGEVVFDMKAHK